MTNDIDYKLKLSTEGMDEAAKLAERLLSLVGALKQDVAGIDGDAAAELQAALQAIVDTVNSLDSEKIAGLGEVLANVEKSAAVVAKAAGDAGRKVAEEASAVADAGRKFSAAFSAANGNDVKVSISTEGMDELESLQARLEAIGDANDAINMLVAVGDEAEEIDAENAERLQAAISTYAGLTKDLSSANIEKQQKAYKDILRIVSALPQKQRETLKSLDLGGLASAQDRLQKAVQGTGDSFDKARSAIGILRGDLSSIGGLIEGLVSKTRLWGAAVAKVGAAKVAGAFGFAAAGISAGVSALMEWNRQRLEIENAISRQRRESAGQAAEGLTEAFYGAQEDLQTIGRGRKGYRVEDAERLAARWRAAERRNMQISAIETEKYRALGLADSSQKREDIERAAERRIETVRSGQALDDAKAGVEDMEIAKAREEARLKSAQKMLGNLNKLSAHNANMLNVEVGKEVYGGPGYKAVDWVKTLVKGADADTAEGIKARIEELKQSGDTVSEAIAKMRKEIAESKTKIVEFNEALPKARDEISKVEREISERAARRNEEDRQRDIERRRASIDFKRGYELERWGRSEAEFQNSQQIARAIGGEAASAGAAGAEYERRRSQLRNSEEAMEALRQRVVDRLQKAGVAVGGNARLDEEFVNRAMTDDERAEYENRRSDYLRDEGNFRAAETAKRIAEEERTRRQMAFQADAMRSQNRLTAMGLGGDVGADFGKETANNTKQLVELTKELVNQRKGTPLVANAAWALQ